MRALSATDELFVVLERAHQPMHVGGLFVLAAPDGDGPRFVRNVLTHFRRFGRPVSPYNERLVLTARGHCWAEDDRFDLRNHVRHAALPSPGGAMELRAWVAAQHEVPLHRDRPLWEIHVIEGLADGRVAAYAKVHHALLDGVSALRYAMSAFTTDRERREAPPCWMLTSQVTERPPPTDSALFEVLAALKRSTSRQLATLPRMTREVRRVVDDLRASWSERDLESPFAQRITSARHFGTLSLRLTRIKELAASFRRTLNDVVLAMCAGALRGYLEERGELPPQPLYAMVPVSLRRGGKAGRGNRVATILANLATHMPDVGERTRALWSSVQATKERFESLSDEQIVGVTALTLTPSFLTMLTRGSAAGMAYQVVISNVPGPREPLFLEGARLEHIYPVSIVADRIGLNITFTSYVDTLDLGFVAARSAVPDMDRLIAHAERALRELEHLAGSLPDP